MIDKWINEDVEKLINLRGKLVIVDPDSKCHFLLKELDINKYLVLETNKDLKQNWQTTSEELFLRYEAERNNSGNQVIFYVTRPQNDLSFLFDYCFTHGCLNLSNPQEWIKNKIYKNTGLNVSMDNPMLLATARRSIGRDITWWKKIVLKLQDVVDLNEELIPFLHDPVKYFEDEDPDIYSLFVEKISELLGQPELEKPPKTIANELVKRMFDGLVNNDLHELLEKLYYKWLDSAVYSSSFIKYLEKYKIKANTNPWAAHSYHCFKDLDLIALKEITSNIRDKSYLAEKLNKLEKRVKFTNTNSFIPKWWIDVFTLLNGNTTGLANCQNINAFIDFYTGNFCRIDRAIRKLYSEFLNYDAIIRPLQEHYDNLNKELLETWFDHRNEYNTDQQGYLVELISKASPKTAVIVGDGVRYEIADFVISELNRQFKIEKDTVMLADMPSETENNMSALYCGNNEVLRVHSDREKKLTELTKKDISYINLADLYEGVNSDYLVLTYKDIDDTGEKLQQGAIKLFDEFENVLIDKVKFLFNIGYKEVHLVTDHGFVLTGLLDEADKVVPKLSGEYEIKERFIRTIDKQNNIDLVEFPKHYGEYKYVYAAKTSRPFKTRGTYGYSHGGFTPQEIIIPNIKFTKKLDTNPALGVYIVNKTELGDITGNIFELKIQSDKEIKGLFASTRKIQILLFSGGKQIQSSNISKIELGSLLSFEFSFNGNSEIQAILIDADSKEQLDEVKVIKSNARDLGGLI